MVDLWELKPGARFETRDGAVAEVVDETKDGHWIEVSYLACEDRPALVGTRDLTHEDEITHVLRAGREGETASG